MAKGTFAGSAGFHDPEGRKAYRPGRLSFTTPSAYESAGPVIVALGAVRLIPAVPKAFYMIIVFPDNWSVVLYRYRVPPGRRNDLDNLQGPDEDLPHLLAGQAALRVPTPTSWER